MVASRQVEIPFYKSFGLQRGWRFGVLAKVIGRPAITFMCGYIVPAAKRVGTDSLEFAVREIADNFNGRKISRQLQRVWENKLWRNNWVVVAAKGVQAESIQQNLQNKPVGREETILQTFLVNHVDDFRYQLFLTVSGILGGKVTVVDDVLSSQEQEIYPTTSLFESA